MKAKKWIGIDIHKKQFTVCVLTHRGKTQTVYERTSEGIKKFLREVDEKTAIGKEATTWTWSMVKKLKEKTKHVMVLNTIELKGLMDRFKKTDHTDAEKIAVIVRRFENGELSLCNIKEDKEAAIQGMLNQRESWVKMKTMLKNKLRSTIEYWGLELPKGYFKDIKKDSEWLSSSGLDINLIESLMRTLGMIIELEEHIAEISVRIKEILMDNKSYQSILSNITGIGPITAAYLVTKIGKIERFENPKKLTAYLGVTPRVKDSDGKGFNGNITKKATKSFLRVMVQSAWASVRFNHKMKEFYERIKQRRGSSRAIIAVARKLIVEVFYVYNKFFYKET